MAEEASGPNEIAWSARKLLRSARQASLATVSQGQPFVSLATPAVAPDGGVLLLLSDLSEHTRHLRAEPRCSMLVAGPANGPNPQTTPRLTANATAAIADTPADRARFLAIHPYAGLYAGFGDFHLWRLTLTGGLFVGGFAVSRTGWRAHDAAPGDGDCRAALPPPKPTSWPTATTTTRQAMAAIAERPRLRRGRKLQRWAGRLAHGDMRHGRLRPGGQVRPRGGFRLRRSRLASFETGPRRVDPAGPVELSPRGCAEIWTPAQPPRSKKTDYVQSRRARRGRSRSRP